MPGKQPEGDRTSMLYHYCAKIDSFSHALCIRSMSPTETKKESVKGAEGYKPEVVRSLVALIVL
jgi:hypothetical protein